MRSRHPTNYIPWRLREPRKHWRRSGSLGALPAVQPSVFNPIPAVFSVPQIGVNPATPPAVTTAQAPGFFDRVATALGITRQTAELLTIGGGALLFYSLIGKRR